MSFSAVKRNSREPYFFDAASGLGMDAYIGGPLWDEFASSWDDLRQDPYMGDGGTYRFRRYSEFMIAGNRISVLPHRAYHQTKDVNHLNGGIERLYDPISASVSEGQVMTELLRRCHDFMPALDDGRHWLVQTFQNRIYAGVDTEGLPAPEGVHRDGVDYVFTLLVKRSNVTGGESGIFPNEGNDAITSMTLAHPGDFIFLDDEAVRHGVTGLRREAPGDEGYRDTLIAMFTRQ